MALVSATAELPRGHAPGVFVEHVAAARTPPAPAWTSGVPAFVGFAQPRPVPPGEPQIRVAVIVRWDAREFDLAIAPAQGSFLRAAVHGYFLNGGHRCLVVMVPMPQGAADRAEALARALQGRPLEDRADIDLVCVPDAVSPLIPDEAGRATIHAAALAHCQAMGDRFAILDAPLLVPPAASHAAADPVATMLAVAASCRSPFGAMYFPWISIDRTRDSGMASGGDAGWRCPPQAAHAHKRDARADGARWIPPCGHVAGLYARIDAQSGEHRSPANEMLEGVVDTSLPISAAQHARLNEGGVNCLRNFHGRGIQVGGARTLSGHDKWAHVSTARVVLGFRRWLAVGMSDLVFEPQTPMLRDRIRMRAVTRCLELQRKGALVEGVAGEAFFVKCDEETNPPGERDLGKVVALVGLAPSVPAEFIVVRVAHDASGFTVSGLSESN